MACSAALRELHLVLCYDEASSEGWIMGGQTYGERMYGVWCMYGGVGVWGLIQIVTRAETVGST